MFEYSAILCDVIALAMVRAISLFTALFGWCVGGGGGLFVFAGGRFIFCLLWVEGRLRAPF